MKTSFSSTSPENLFIIVITHSPSRSSLVFPSYKGVSFLVALSSSLRYALPIAFSAFIVVYVIEQFLQCVEYLLRAPVVPSGNSLVLATVALRTQRLQVILVKQQLPIHIITLERASFMVDLFGRLDNSAGQTVLTQRVIRQVRLPCIPPSRRVVPFLP